MHVKVLEDCTVDQDFPMCILEGFSKSQWKLLAPYVYGFMLHQEYKVGVIYLAVLNLPRDMRYKRENIVVGIIPGPSEPSTTINSYLFAPSCNRIAKIMGWSAAKHLR